MNYIQASNLSSIKKSGIFIVQIRPVKEIIQSLGLKELVDEKLKNDEIHTLIHKGPGYHRQEGVSR